MNPPAQTGAPPKKKGNGVTTPSRRGGSGRVLTDVIVDLGFDGPVVDPTTLSQEELLEEVQHITKALLAYGARMPKVLMLFVKNLIYLSSMIEHLAPDIDMIREVQLIGMRFAIEHGSRIAATNCRATPLNGARWP